MSCFHCSSLAAVANPGFRSGGEAECVLSYLERGWAVVVRSRLQGRRVPGSRPDSIEEAPCSHGRRLEVTTYITRGPWLVCPVKASVLSHGMVCVSMGAVHQKRVVRGSRTSLGGKAIHTARQVGVPPGADWGTRWGSTAMASPP
ncbi:hypothetical protein AVEN_101645-2 [Araneus ventricosus]|uniref:Uncharacterized protein n=1 Tax=Araneus ventricosus TaxID=182803 RepID=A0A4Y2EYM4_ARAVE|nr:hypothetical protein AVEN_101645-2 [Araneus ventricosus]